MRYLIAVVFVMVLVVSAEAKEKPKAKKKASSVKIQENAVVPSDVIAEKTITDNVTPNPVTVLIIEDNTAKTKVQDNAAVPKKEEVCQVKKEVSVRDMSPREFDLYVAQLTLKAGIEFGVLRPDMQIGLMSIDHFDLVLKRFKLNEAQVRGIIQPGTEWKQLTQEQLNKMHSAGIQRKGIFDYVLPLK